MDINKLAIIRKNGKMKYYLLLICATLIISCSNRTEKENNFLTVGNLSSRLLIDWVAIIRSALHTAKVEQRL